MRVALLITPLVGLALVACTSMAGSEETLWVTSSSTSTTTTCSTTRPPVPVAPTEQIIPDTGAMPGVPASSHIVVVIYPLGGDWAAAGVDTTLQSFTFLYTGKTPSLSTVLTRLYSTRIPVTIYTAPLDLPCYERVPTTRSAERLVRQFDDEEDGGIRPPQRGDGGSDGGSGSHCTDCGTDISDDPGGIKKPGGDDWLPAFLELVWRLSLAVEGVATPPLTGGVSGTH